MLHIWHCQEVNQKLLPYVEQRLLGLISATGKLVMFMCLWAFPLTRVLTVVTWWFTVKDYTPAPVKWNAFVFCKSACGL